MTHRPRLLDLYSGAGGAGYGYYLAGFDVTGVDIIEQPRYPRNEHMRFIQGDALEYAAAHGHEYDAIHASPPCQRYSRITLKRFRENHPDSIPPVRQALCELGLPYVIENVEGARYVLQNPIVLCGSSFGLRVWRHRWFEIFPIMILAPSCQHEDAPIVVSNSSTQKQATKIEAALGMGIDWMNRAELGQAIPPAYTEYIGVQFIRYVQSRRIMKTEAQS